jgi:hypothetical protein
VMWRTPVIVSMIVSFPHRPSRESCGCARGRRSWPFGGLQEIISAHGYCHKVVQPSVVRRINRHRVIRHHTEKMSMMTLACSTFITIEVAAMGEPI